MLFLPLLISAATTAPQLWPLPTSASFGDPTLPSVRFASVVFTVPSGADPVLAAAAARYAKIITAVGGAHNGSALSAVVTVANGNAPLSPGSTLDETYTITKSAGSGSPIAISAPSQWGAIKAFETLSQAITKGGDGMLMLPGGRIAIADAPRFSWRGLMIDTGRNYLSVTTLKMCLDAMAYTKLNVLHWHLTDDQSFPIIVPTLPHLAEGGAFSPRHTYTTDDIAAVVAYARARGIAVLPELDVPGHTSSWTQPGGEAGLRSRCTVPGASFSAPLDPTQNATYAMLRTLLATLDPLFANRSEFPYWHMGGDEVEYDCWKQSTDGYIDAWMSAHGIAQGDYPALQQHFEGAVVEMVHTLPRGAKRTVLWEDNSAAHTGGLPKDAVVEVWKEAKGDASVLDATISAGWDVIYTSRDWYFDHQPAATTLLVQSWEFHYSLDPYEHSTHTNATLDAKVLGAEACAWAPSFDATNFLTAVFPGAAAVAERLWSDSGVTSVDAARPRLHAWRCRLLARGLPTAPIAGGVSTGARGDAPPGASTSFGGHCADGPWETPYAPPF